MTESLFPPTPGPARHALRRRPVIGGFLAAGVIALALSVQSAVAADPPGEESFSQANRLLFMQDHLTGVDYPARYRYRFSKSGTLNDFDDEIVMEARDSDGSGQAKQVHLEYFSGERQKHVPDIDSARGNPVIMMFLQRDVAEMSELTGGNWRYFQRQIKLALENAADVEAVTLDYEGHPVAGQRITLQPFSDEREHRRELADYLDKTYRFTLSDAVPGSVYELETSTPQTSDVPIVEQLVLEDIERLSE
ncbi:hypothetical protein GCM10027040_15730 [Halomonas shantousis]